MTACALTLEQATEHAAALGGISIPAHIDRGANGLMPVLGAVSALAVMVWIQSLDAIPIDRDGLGLGGIKESLRRLKRGEMLLIFPEGRRTDDGEVADFRPGFTALAVRSKVAILPVAIEGAFAAWPRCA